MEKGGASDDQPGAADAVGALGRSARARWRREQPH
jgi:hypothetical protein